MFTVPLAVRTDLKLCCLVLFASIRTRWTPFPQEPPNPQLGILSNSYPYMKISLYKTFYSYTGPLFVYDPKKERKIHRIF